MNGGKSTSWTLPIVILEFKKTLNRMMIGWFKGEFSIKLKEIATPFAETASRPVLIPLM